MIIDCDYSERKYRRNRRLANSKDKTRKKRYPKYEKVQKFRDNNCMPNKEAIKMPSDDCIYVGIEDLLHHQAAHFITTTTKEKMLHLKSSRNAKFILYWEYGKYFFSDIFFSQYYRYNTDRKLSVLFSREYTINSYYDYRS